VGTFTSVQVGNTVNFRFKLLVTYLGLTHIRKIPRFLIWTPASRLRQIYRRCFKSYWYSS